MLKTQLQFAYKPLLQSRIPLLLTPQQILLIHHFVEGQTRNQSLISLPTPPRYRL